MKARVKATGKLLKNVIPIISVDDKIVMFHEGGTDNDYYYYEDLDFNDVTDWQQVRIQAAIAAMNGYQSAPIIPGCDPNPPLQDVARWSVKLADELINELKRTKERGTV